ncbi:MAG: putative Ig domain-containing protein [bacterium]|nr:putative Ig domain-containing protein [bacterium]
MKNTVKVSIIAVFTLAIVIASFPLSASASHDSYDTYDYGYDYYPHQDPYDCYWSDDCYRYPNTAYYSSYPGDNRFNQAPEIESWPRENARVGELYTYNVNAYDRDRDRISYFLDRAPSGMRIDRNDGYIEWTPSSEHAGTIQYVTVTAEDRYGNDDSQSFSINVEGPRTAVVTNPSPTPTVVEVPVVRTVVVQAQPTVLGTVSGINMQALELYNVRTYIDESGNVFVSWETNKPSRGRVHYGLASQATKGANFVYEYTSPDSGAVSTIHSVMLGNLQMERTYYFRVVSEVGNERRISPDHSFIRVNEGIGAISATNNVALGSALGVIGSAIFSPALLLLIIIILLIAVVIRRRRKKTVRIVEPAKIEIA